MHRTIRARVKPLPPRRGHRYDPAWPITITPQPPTICYPTALTIASYTSALGIQGHASALQVAGHDTSLGVGGHDTNVSIDTC